MANTSQKAMLPQMAGGQNDGGVSEYEREQLKIKNEMAARAAAIAAPQLNVGGSNVTPVDISKTNAVPPAPPAPRVPLPDPLAYWVDVYGKVLSTRKGEARVVLTVTNELWPKQLEAIVKMLNEHPELESK